MYQTIHESISVSGTFKNAFFAPKNFTWQKRNYAIQKITSTHELRDGGVAKRRYAVISDANLYLLEYNRQEETWLLEQVWIEG